MGGGERDGVREGGGSVGGGGAGRQPCRFWAEESEVDDSKQIRASPVGRA